MTGRNSVETVLEQIRDTISRVEDALGLDWRFSYSGMRAVGKGELELELSREDVMRALLDQLDGFSVTQGGEDTVLLHSSTGACVKMILLDGGSGSALWVSSSVADFRRTPSHSAELLTQAIMGDSALPLKREGEWYLASLGDGYHGWVNSWYVSDTNISDVDSYNCIVNARVLANVGYILSSPDAGSPPVSDVVSGTRLVAGDSSGGFRKVILPAGREGFIREGDISELLQVEPSRTRLIERAKGFLGIPYLWGGTSAKGFDCSGLVKHLFLLEGIELPRDSDLQARAGRMITRDRIESARPGDLLVFGDGGAINHTAVYAGKGRFVHAYGEVRFNSFHEDDPIYEEKLAETLLFARSIIGEQL